MADKRQSAAPAPPDQAETPSATDSGGEAASPAFRLFTDLALVLRFFTRLPLPLPAAATSRPLACAAWAFPLVGPVTGGIGAGTIVLALLCGLPPWCAAFLALAVTAALTGALHEDGLADTADGLWGGHDPARRLAIMRDSHIGTYGVLALLLATGLKAAALAELMHRTGPYGAMAALIAAHSIGRAMMAVVMGLFPLAGRSGLAAAAGHAGRVGPVIACLLAAAIAFALTGPWLTLAAFLSALLLALGLGWLAQRRIGGYSGDILGAVEQIGETAVLLAILAMTGSMIPGGGL